MKKFTQYNRPVWFVNPTGVDNDNPFLSFLFVARDKDSCIAGINYSIGLDEKFKGILNMNSIRELDADNPKDVLLFTTHLGVHHKTLPDLDMPINRV